MSKLSFIFFNFIFMLSTSLVFASKAKPVIIGNPSAPVGGTFNQNLDAEPANLNPLRAADAYAPMVYGYIFDSLLTRNIETYEHEAALAESWDVAKDGKSITFTLRSNAKFHDGTPVTAEDVKFSFDVRFDSKFSDATYRSYYENIESAEILSPTKIKFNIKKKYFGNLDVVGSMEILPKAYYGNPNKKMNKTVMGSGPYIFDQYDQGKSIILKRNPSWWGFELPQFKGYYKFEKIRFKFIGDPTAQLESFKKGEFDMLGLRPEQYEKQTDGEMWGKTVFKVSAENSARKSSGFVGFNLRSPLFKDKKVRQALSLLFNRKMMIKKFFYDKYLPSSGPWYPHNPSADPTAKPYAYDPKLARKLLNEAGWSDSNKDGVLDKVIDGKRTDFKFEVLIATNIWEKYLTVYKEELKKSGIELNIKLVEWNAFAKIIDESNKDHANFDTLAMGWRESIEMDPKQIWHSDSIQKGGSNFVGYSNPVVDKLIDQAREELNDKKRHKMLAKVYKIIADDYPYLFLWAPKYSLYAYSSRVKMVKPTYRYSIGADTWWSVEKK